MGNRVERREGFLQSGQHVEQRRPVFAEGEVEADHRPAIGGTEPEIVGRDDADLGNQQAR